MWGMDTETLLKEMEELFRGKLFLTVEDITALLSCDAHTVYNWTKRADPQRRPPRIFVGRELRFPRKPFLHWLVSEQSSPLAGHS